MAGRARIDRLSAVLAVPLLAALPLTALSYRANRIAPPEPRSLAEIFGPVTTTAIIVATALLAILLLIERRPGIRALLLVPALALVLVFLGQGAAILLAAAQPAARVSPGTGFWLAFGALGLLLMDAIARHKPNTRAKALLLLVAVIAMALLVQSGLLSNLSIAAEYRARAAPFQQALFDHLTLAFASFGVALLVGLPIGVLIQRRPGLRGVSLNLLTMIQTIPSIALFGMLIVPLAWVAANLPGAAALGIKGIGMAPALIALFLYALLPIVGNTVAGLDAVPPEVSEAAESMGMTRSEQRWKVDLPLALPVILAGARVVLVQNIGLATIGALIGSGGFGSFIFQGIGQTAPDLILLGVLPVVLLAFLTSAIMDLLIAFLRGEPS